MERIYCVYKHTTPNGKNYIGQTKRDINERWANGAGYTCHKHGFFWKAVQKYGWENIKHEILIDNLTKKEADYYEKFYIALYQTTDREYGYNARTGGSSGYEYTEEAKQNISKGLKDFYKKNGKPDTSHAREVLQRKQGHPVVQYDLNGNKIAVFASSYDAFLKTGISNKKINRVVLYPEKKYQADGYMWRYIEDAPDKLPMRKSKILFLDEEKKIIGIYKTQREAAQKTGIAQSTIGNSLNHRFKKLRKLKNKKFVYESEVEHEDLKLKEQEVVICQNTNSQ